MTPPEETSSTPAASIPPPIQHNNPNGFGPIRNWFAKRALFFKITAIAFLALLLLIPLGLVKDTLHERQARYGEAVDSITAPWGGAQRIVGPVLVVPFTHKVETEEWVVVGTNRFKDKKTREYTREAFFLPEQLNVQGALEPSERQRAIYKAHVYSASLKITGKFDKPDFAFTALNDVQPQWDRARVCFAVTDLRGVRESLTLVWAGDNVSMQPGAQFNGFSSGLHATLPGERAKNGAAFSLELTLNGSDLFLLAPLARSTKMTLTSPWPDPSFCGAYLPVHRDISDAGFTARWEASFYARGVPQQWMSGAGGLKESEASAPSESDLTDGSFGVRMLPAVSAYRIVERAIKYGILFIALVFTVFFLFEAVAGLRLSSINYLLAGATLCVFFLGLLALSEFVPFGAAYAISGALAILMLGLYCARILHSAKRALGVSAMLAGVYAYLYFVLRMEDFALLAGTAAVFAVLGAVMYATRNLRGDESGAKNN